MLQGGAKFAVKSTIAPPVSRGVVRNTLIGAFMDDESLPLYFSGSYPFLYRGHKSLKMLPDSISEGVVFQNFLGGHAPRPPRFGMLRMHVCFAHNLHVYVRL